MNDKKPDKNKMNNGKIKNLLIILVVSLIITLMLNGVFNQIQKGNE